jgi:hypothetical protein
MKVWFAFGAGLATFAYLNPDAWFYIATTVFAYVLTDSLMGVIPKRTEGDSFRRSRWSSWRGHLPTFFLVAGAIVFCSLTSDYIAKALFAPYSHTFTATVLLAPSLLVAWLLDLHIRTQYNV